jgi:hypothetical protein
MTIKKNKPGQGRPKNTIPTAIKTITLQAYLLDWLEQYPGSVSQNINKILGAIYEQHNKK